MAIGNFSNGGQDTFDARKHYIGIRLQQGVPLLDRDWNELEDIRRWYERTLRQSYLGQGVPDDDGFRISAPPVFALNDFVIAPGRCLVDGYDVENESALFYSQQVGVPPLPAPDRDDILYVYLLPSVQRVDASTDPDLRNAQDINLETCLRDKLAWQVLVARHPELPPPEGYLLARINRPNGRTVISAPMIVDARRTGLNVARVADSVLQLQQRLAQDEALIHQMQLDIQTMKQELARLFWDVKLDVPSFISLFGGSGTITATVVDGLNQPVQNARLTFTTDWGYITPSTAATNASGVASATLYALESDVPPPPSHISILGGIASKVEKAKVPGSDVIQYSNVKLQPEEMKMVSLYTPASQLANVGIDLPTSAIVSLPPSRTATVTVHAKEGDGAVVRGVGSVQVYFRIWTIDYVKNSIFEVASKVQVASRVSDLLRQSVVNNKFDLVTAQTKIDSALQGIHDDIHGAYVNTVFENPALSLDDLSQTGTVGQMIQEQAIATVGARANATIDSQLSAFTADPTVQLTKTDAVAAKSSLFRLNGAATASATSQAKVLSNSMRTFS